jgi:hypothetical protein
MYKNKWTFTVRGKGEWGGNRSWDSRQVRQGVDTLPLSLVSQTISKFSLATVFELEKYSWPSAKAAKLVFGLKYRKSSSHCSSIFITSLSEISLQKYLSI